MLLNEARAEAGCGPLVPQGSLAHDDARTTASVADPAVAVSGWLADPAVAAAIADCSTSAVAVGHAGGEWILHLG